MGLKGSQAKYIFMSVMWTVDLSFEVFTNAQNWPYCQIYALYIFHWSISFLMVQFGWMFNNSPACSHTRMLFTALSSVQTKRKRTLSLMFAVYSLIFFTCSLIFFAFAFARCEQALTAMSM